jgi:hypothetical protein
MVPQVGEERVSVGRLEGRLSRPHSMLELAPCRERLAPAMQGEVAHGSGRARVQQGTHPGERDPVVLLDADQPDTRQPVHEPAQHARLRIGRGAQVVDRHRAVGEQLRQSQASHHIHELDRHEPEQQLAQSLRIHREPPSVHKGLG